MAVPRLIVLFTYDNKMLEKQHGCNKKTGDFPPVKLPTLG
jgi:hypothetical protein